MNKLNTTPTRAEYVGRTARDFLTILDAVAQTVPVPGFGAAVKVAVNIIKACDESQATLESAKNLKDRIQGLVVVFVHELKGAKEEDIRAELIRDIDILKEEMEYIKARLDEITSQKRFLLLLFRSINNDKVNACVARLNNVIEKFMLKRTIDNVDMFTQLKRQITVFYDEQRAFHIEHKEDLKVLQLGMDGVKAILDERLPAGATLSSPSRAPIPANSTIFHGRDSLVSDLVNIITAAPRKHICLLGPGGMGKTSTSLAAMGHPDVKAKYENQLRVWVPCVKAKSASLFLDTLKSSLAIPKDTGDPRGAIITTLQASLPIIILLDNFETPWDADGAQMEVAQLLRDVHDIPHVTVFVTMRSSAPPCDDIPWHHVDLRGVDATAAREIYAAKHPEGHDDPNLPHLLELIGHMPLAIMLMAKVAKVTHLSASELMDEYNKLGTSMLGQGSDAVSSMDVCIGLSVYSPRMKAHPEAFDLLCALSMLPTGTSYQMLSKWWASNLSNLPGALDVLRGALLIEERGSTYFVLPVVQRYILDPTRFSPEVHMSMIASACTFLKQHESKIGDPLYKEHVAALSLEEGNLEAVLLQVTTPDPHIIRDGLLLLAQYQQDNRPRVDVVEHALKLVQAFDDNLLRGDILYCYGDICETCLDYDKSLQLFKAALDVFLSVHDRKKAGESCLAISRVLNCHPARNFDSQQELIQEAQKGFESMNYEGGVGRCYMALGELNLEYGNYSIAITMLTEAEKILTEVKNQNQHAQCTQALGWASYQVCQHDLASSWAMLSLQEYERTGDSLGCWLALQDLGKISYALGDYKSSLEYFLQSLSLRKSMGLPPLGLALEGLGLAWAKLGKTVDAHRAFEEAFQQYSSQIFIWDDSQNGILRTQFFLKHLENSNLSPSSEELRALYYRYTRDHIDKILTLV